MQLNIIHATQPPHFAFLLNLSTIFIWSYNLTQLMHSNITILKTLQITDRGGEWPGWRGGLPSWSSWTWNILSFLCISIYIFWLDFLGWRKGRFSTILNLSSYVCIPIFLSFVCLFFFCLSLFDTRNFNLFRWYRNRYKKNLVKEKISDFVYVPLCLLMCTFRWLVLAKACPHWLHL